MDKIETLKKYIEESNKIVFLTGAGVSCASGIPDFRSTDGLYNIQYKYRPEVILSHSFFMKNPKEFYRFYKNKMVYPDSLPNYSHIAISKLQETKDVSVVTQNIDGLHHFAKTNNVYELHGTVYSNHCMKCKRRYLLDEVLLKLELDALPICECGGLIKPDVVLYEENLNEHDIYKAIDDISTCDMLIVMGSSLTVYPVASFINYYKENKLVIINLTETPYDYKANLVIHDKCEEVLKEVVK